MKNTRLNVIAWKVGRAVGWAYYPVTFLIVAYGAYVAAEIVGRN